MQEAAAEKKKNNNVVAVDDGNIHYFGSIKKRKLNNVVAANVTADVDVIAVTTGAIKKRKLSRQILLKGPSRFHEFECCGYSISYMNLEELVQKWDVTILPPCPSCSVQIDIHFLELLAVHMPSSSVLKVPILYALFRNPLHYCGVLILYRNMSPSAQIIKIYWPLRI